MRELECEDSLDIVRIVAITFQVTRDHMLDESSIEIGSTRRSCVEEYFPNIRRELLPEPHAEVLETVQPDQPSLRPENAKVIMHLFQPLRHAALVAVIGLKQELQYLVLQP